MEMRILAASSGRGCMAWHSQPPLMAAKALSRRG